MSVPIIFKWVKGAMHPLGRFHNLLSQYEEGELYRLAEVEDRSMRSHRHFFASLKDAWLNLPEIYAQEWPSPEHLRKRALIECGYYDKRAVVLDSKSDAIKVAAFMRQKDEFAVIKVEGRTVLEFTAKSQSVPAMNKADFQQSKYDVLAYAWGLSGVDVETAQQHAGRAA